MGTKLWKHHLKAHRVTSTSEEGFHKQHDVMLRNDALHYVSKLKMNQMQFNDFCSKLTKTGFMTFNF